MDWGNAKSFTTHKCNGVLLKFPNGNTLSTIWDGGSYTEHHYDSFMLTPENNGGSMTAEIMFDTHGNTRLDNLIYRHLHNNSDNGVIGWVTMDNWLWVVNQLANAK